MTNDPTICTPPDQDDQDDQEANAAPTKLIAILRVLERIDDKLGQQSSPVLSRKPAATFLGVSPATLDRLAANVEKLRPIHPSPGRSVWRKADLQAYLDNL